MREGIYAFYDNYVISGFILTVSDNIYTDRSKIIAGEKSSSLSIEFGSNVIKKETLWKDIIKQLETLKQD